MDNVDPQGSPGVNHEYGIPGSILANADSESVLGDWTDSTTNLNEEQKNVSSSPLLFLTVEYVDEHTTAYDHSALTDFEQGTSFGLQPSESLSEFDHTVGPLDPNMGSTGRFSPVYPVNGNEGSLKVSGKISAHNNTKSSNLCSPFSNQVVVLTSPASPLPSAQSIPASPLTNTIVTSSELAEGFVQHMLSNPVPSSITCTSPSSSRDSDNGLLSRVVAEDNPFTQPTSTAGSNLASGLGELSLNSTHPGPQLDTSFTSPNNYIGSSENLHGTDCRSSNFSSNESVCITNTSGSAQSSTALMIHSSSIQQTSEVTDAADSSPFHNLESSAVITASHNESLKPDSLDRVQLLISSSDGSITYSLNGQNEFLPTQIVNVDNELLDQRAVDDQTLNSMIDSFKAHGFVFGGCENGELQFHPPPSVDSNSEEKLVGTLDLQEYTLAVRQENELLQQSLLTSSVNGDLEDNIARFSESLLNDAVKISVIDSSLEAEVYSDMLVDSPCNTIENQISRNNSQESNVLNNFESSNTRTHKGEENDNAINKDVDNNVAKTLRNVANSTLFNDGCCSHSHHKSILECALSSLPACYLTISKIPLNKASYTEYGVFARKTIPKKTQFGPIEGVPVDFSEFSFKIEQPEVAKHLVFLTENEFGLVQKIDISNENCPSWMNYIRVASTFKEQNLILNQQGQCLFFTTTKVIHPRQELRVWYSLPYARKHGLPFLQPVKFDVQGCGEPNMTWSCFKCNKNFSNPLYLQCHLNIHDHEVDRMEVSTATSAEKENHNLSQEMLISALSSKKLKTCGNKLESCLSDCHTCNNDIRRKCKLKKCRVSRARKYLCEVCGFQFTHLRSKDCHFRKSLKDTNMNDSKVISSFPRNKLLKLYSECRKNKMKTGWYCDHCNLTFDSPSNCNLHTLVHAVENVEETEIIADLGNDFSNVSRKSIGGGEFCCPKCSEKVQSSEVCSSTGRESLKIMQPSTRIQSNILSEQSCVIQCSNAPGNENEPISFMDAQVVAMNTAELFAQTTSEESQFNSVLNSFKIEEDKFSESLDLQDLSIAQQQPQHDLGQSMLVTPTGGELSDGVVCFSQFDDVKVSIEDSGIDPVETYTDIFLESTCVENSVANEDSKSGLPLQTTKLYTELDLTRDKIEMFNFGENFLKSPASVENTTKTKGTHKPKKKSLFARVSEKLPATYLSIRRIKCKAEEEPVCGVFARKAIRRRTRFGPIQGVLSPDITENKEQKGRELKFLLETKNGKVQKLDILRKKAFNWLRYIRVASSCNEQNVFLSQEGQSLFLTTTQAIKPKQELRIWYSVIYASRHGLPFLQPLKYGLKSLFNLRKLWTCFECKQYFKVSIDLQYHLNIHKVEKLCQNDKIHCKKTCDCWTNRTISHSKKRKPIRPECQVCRNPFHPSHVRRRKDFQKRQRLRARNKRYSCEVCGLQFCQSHRRDEHVQRSPKNLGATCEPQPVVSESPVLNSDSENRTSLSNSEWFCSHCNLTFNSASVCNLHTLVHAVENVEETEVISGIPNDFTIFPKNNVEKDLRCPKCTKKVETSESSGFVDCGVTQVLESSQQIYAQTSSLPNEQLMMSSMESNPSYNFNEQNNFIETQVVDMVASEFLSVDDNQLSAVLNSLKMQGLVGEPENSEEKAEDTSSNDQLVRALGMSALAISVQQQQNDLIQQALLASPLNADFSENIARLTEALLSDEMCTAGAPSLETVGVCSDILIEKIKTEITGNSSPQKSSELCAEIVPEISAVPENILLVEENKIDDHVNVDKAQQTKLYDSEQKGKSQDIQSYPENLISKEIQPLMTIASVGLPTTYLAIMKLPCRKSEITGFGVFACQALPKRAQFGPIESILANVQSMEILPTDRKEQLPTELSFSIEKADGNFQKLYVSPKNNSCWIRYIRIARSFKEQNLVLNQQGESLFLTATKMIYPKQELRVWYSFPYARKRNLPFLQPDILTKNCLSSVDKMWPCFECSEQFPSSGELQIHLNIHDFQRDEEISFDKKKLRKINHNFRRKSLLHLSSNKYKNCSDKESEGFPYQCHICNRTFPKNYNLKRHQLLHLKDKKYVCDICGYKFSHMYNRDRHIRKRHKGVNDGSVTSLSAFLKKKLALKSGLQNGKSCFEWFCSNCALSFDNLEVMNLHSLSHSDEIILDKGTIKCPQCCEEYSNKKELIDHVTKHGKLISVTQLRTSLNPAKPWKCDICYKSFATEDRLQRHMLVHGAEESKPLQCDICYKRFLNNSALACHIKIHTAEKKMFECPMCKIHFEQVLLLKEHVHSHSVNGLYTCPHCSKVFDGYSLIRKHIRAFHSDRKHTCNYCGKLFPKLDKLRMHMLRHSDHREFLCANCGKQFKRKDKLKEHMKRMHSAERELRLAMKPHRPTTAKKFMPKVQVSPTDYHRFIYKCHTCLLGFKRRGMLVNHLAKRHPDISPESVPELNLPILKTTRDYYCQYCEKVYKSSSKRKAHILKCHPGAELPMSNRRKGGIPDVPGLPNPTFSQTVGSITTRPHGCPWCHKQYASKAKLLQHQRKKHLDLLPQTQQMSSVDDQLSHHSNSESQIILSQSEQNTQHGSESTLTQLHGIENVINILPGDYHISTHEDDLCEFHESGIIINTSAMERPLKVLPDGIPADLLSQAMSELTNEFRVSVSNSPNDHYLHIVQTSPGHITVTQSPNSPDSNDKDSLTSSVANTILGDSDTLSPSSVPNSTSSQLHRLLSENYSLPSSPSPSPSPQTWSNAHVTYTPYTAR